MNWANIILLLFLLLIVSKLPKKDFFSTLDYQTESKFPKETYFKLIQKSLNKTSQIPSETEFVKVENVNSEVIGNLESILLKEVNDVIKKENGIASIDRNINNIYSKKNKDIEYIYYVVLNIANKQLGVGDLYFLKVYANNSEIFRIEQDFSKYVDFISYNYDSLDVQKIDRIKSDADKILVKQFNKIEQLLNTLNTGYTLPDYKLMYIKHPYNIKFVINNKIRDFILYNVSYLLKKDTEFREDIINSYRDLYDIYYQNTMYDRYYVFNMDVYLQKKAINLKLVVCVLIPNIDKYIDNKSGDFFDSASQLLTNNDIKIEYIKVEKNVDSNNDTFFSPLEQNRVSDYYTITNKLHLLSPFQDGDKDIKITDKMLKAHSEKLQRISNYNVSLSDISKMGFCYDTDRTSNLAGIKDKMECENNGGIWDHPPMNNIDCPFYKINQNYSNELGKVIGASCQLPMNMRLIGNRYYSDSENYQPLCYNCKENDKRINKGTLGYCCEEQKNSELYPGLLSPDYAFNGDTVFRKAAISELQNKNLSVD